MWPLAILAVFIFCFWLMFHTFTYSDDGDLLIASKAYSDFGSHIPLIRSFSAAVNWPPQYPLFPGEPIRYHYLFYLFVGVLERLGLRIDIALNVQSALGLCAFALGLGIFASRLFRSFLVGIVAMVFIFFNSSLTLPIFIQSASSLSGYLDQLIHSSKFVSFGPWDGGEVSAFWNLNIFTNQRHLGLAFATTIILVYLLYIPNTRSKLISGFLLGSLLLLNQAAFIIGAVFYLWALILRPERLFLFVSLLGAIPWLILYLLTVNVSSSVSLNFGFLTPPPITIFSLAKYAIYNYGLHFVLLPVGLYFAPKCSRLIILPALTIFLLAYTFQLSPDIINNHKLLNFFLTIAGVFSANLIVKFLHRDTRYKILATTIFVALISGGVVDYFPIKNDIRLHIPDYNRDPVANFFLLKTAADSVVLNSTWFYHPASLAGRKIYNGYPYFTWSYGYDQTDRENDTAAIYSSTSKHDACNRLITRSIDYVELNTQPEDFLPVNWPLWNDEFIADYISPLGNQKIYSVSRNCL